MHSIMKFCWQFESRPIFQKIKKLFVFYEKFKLSNLMLTIYVCLFLTPSRHLSDFQIPNFSNIFQLIKYVEIVFSAFFRYRLKLFCPKRFLFASKTIFFLRWHLYPRRSYTWGVFRRRSYAWRDYKSYDELGNQQQNPSRTAGIRRKYVATSCWDINARRHDQ